jgi:WD40 repeat protein
VESVLNPLAVIVIICNNQVLQIHEGPVLCCSISPSGKEFISSGQDEQICIVDCATGEKVSSLDEALDGKGLTVKYSFDGTRVQV